MILKIPTPFQSRMIAFLETNNKTFDKRYGIIVCILGLTISPRACPPTSNPFKVQPPGGLCTFYLKKKSSAFLLQAREMLLSLTSISNQMCLFSSIHLQTLAINDMHCIQPKICTFKNRICTSFFTALLTYLNRQSRTHQNS